MGRKKINIKTIHDERNRQITFAKRKFGLLKKAYELSILCDCNVGIIIFSDTGKLYQFSNNSMEEILLRYTEYTDSFDTKNNDDIEGILSRTTKSPDPNAEDELDEETCYQYDEYLNKCKTYGSPDNAHSEQQYHHHQQQQQQQYNHQSSPNGGSSRRQVNSPQLLELDRIIEAMEIKHGKEIFLQNNSANRLSSINTIARSRFTQ